VGQAQSNGCPSPDATYACLRSAWCLQRPYLWLEFSHPTWTESLPDWCTSQGISPLTKILHPPANGQQNSVKNTPFSTNSVSDLSSARRQMHLLSTNLFYLDLREQGESKHRGCPGQGRPQVNASAARAGSPTHAFLTFTFVLGRERRIERGIQDKQKTS